MAETFFNAMLNQLTKNLINEYQVQFLLKQHVDIEMKLMNMHCKADMVN